jgi:hypothetical protein
VAGEKDGGAGGMELCVGDGQRGDVKGLQMWVRVSVDLFLSLFVCFLLYFLDFIVSVMNEKHGH